MNIGWRINKLKVGDIIIAYVPYEEGQGGKYRPVLIFILTGDEEGFIGLKITSKPRNKNRIKIEKWKEAGLSMPSYVQCDNYTFFKVMSGIKKIGRISGQDFEKVVKKFNELN